MKHTTANIAVCLKLLGLEYVKGNKQKYVGENKETNTF